VHTASPAAVDASASTAAAPQVNAIVPGGGRTTSTAAMDHHLIDE
jgi:hypothetical protein